MNLNEREIQSRMTFSNTQQIAMYSVPQYIQMGLKIGLNIAIDFTASNGEPTSS